MIETSNVSIYFANHSVQQITESTDIANLLGKFDESKLESDCQQIFCEEIESSVKQIPWNLLRALQFDLDQNVRTAVCCDPVLMQMTHRGAYLWGQQQLTLTKEEVILIIAQINQQLMGDGENFYMLDNDQWLYTSTKQLDLKQSSFENYIGKDIFGFRYSGKDGQFWQRLATEIQMLIKQMMDYQGLTPVPAEMILNVHFWADSELQLKDVKVNNRRSQVVTSDALMQTFCDELDVTSIELKNYQTLLTEHAKKIEIESSKKQSDISFYLPKVGTINIYLLVEACIELCHRAPTKRLRIITQDKILTLNKKPSLFEKIKAIFA